MLNSWWSDIPKSFHKDFHYKYKTNSPFLTQYQALKDEYNHFSQTTPYQIHPTAILTSKPINTKQIAQLLQNPDQQQQALELEIKKLEKEIGRQFTKEQKELVKEFISIKKKIAEELEDKLNEKEILEEDVNEIILYCDRLIEKLEGLQLQAQVEIIPTNNFQGQLVVEDYSKVEKLNLRDIRNLVVEDCPQLKKLVVCKNLLTNFEFLKDLENLEELKFDDLQELSKAIKENPQVLSELRGELNFSQQKYNNLKKSLTYFSEEVQKQVLEKEINELGSKLDVLKVTSTTNTKEIILMTKTNIEKLKKFKEEKEDELAKYEAKIQELKKKLEEQENIDITKRTEQLETKIAENQEELENIISKYELNKMMKLILESLLNLQKKITTLEVNNQHNQSLESKKKELMDCLKESNLEFSQELDKICQIKAKITRLEIQLQATSNYADHKDKLIKHIKKKLIAGLTKKDTDTINPVVGGGITLISSAVDSVSSEIENSKTKEQEIFINFFQEFTNLERGYRDLKKTSEDLLLISNVSTFPEEINKEIKNLKQEVDNFFQKYDTDQNNEIDDSE
ncbi:1132_t:CDS:2, partial [Gigaspora margarita]